MSNEEHSEQKWEDRLVRCDGYSYEIEDCDILTKSRFYYLHINGGETFAHIGRVKVTVNPFPAVGCSHLAAMDTDFRGPRVMRLAEMDAYVRALQDAHEWVKSFDTKKEA